MMIIMSRTGKKKKVRGKKSITGVVVLFHFLNMVEILIEILTGIKIIGEGPAIEVREGLKDIDQIVLDITVLDIVVQGENCLNMMVICHGVPLR